MSDRTLSEYADTIEELVRREQALQDVDAQVTDLAGLKDGIRRFADHVSKCLRLHGLLKQAGISTGARTEFTVGIANELAALRAADVIDREALRTAVASHRKDATSRLESVRNAAVRIWEQEVETAGRKLPEEAVVDALQRLDAAKAARIRTIRQELDALGARHPTTPEECGLPGRLREEVEVILQQTESIPSAVAEFFDCVGQGIDLGAIEAEVLDWLREHDLTRDYVVVPRAHLGRRSV